MMWARPPDLAQAIRGDLTVKVMPPPKMDLPGPAPYHALALRPIQWMMMAEIVMEVARNHKP